MVRQLVPIRALVPSDVPYTPESLFRYIRHLMGYEVNHSEDDAFVDERLDMLMGSRGYIRDGPGGFQL